MAVALRGAYLTGIRTRVSRVKAAIYYENHSSVSCSSIRVCFRAPSGVLSFPAIAFRLTHPSVITIYTMKYRSTRGRSDRSLRCFGVHGMYSCFSSSTLSCG